MILHVSRMRRKVNRKVYKDRKNVSATLNWIQVTRHCVSRLHDRTPAYIASLIMPYVRRRALRSADRALLAIPRYNLERYGRRSFSRAGPTQCNALHDDSRSTKCMNNFKGHLKTYDFKNAFNGQFFRTHFS